MDARLIDNINRKVKKDDTLYHLGDFAYPKYRSVSSYRSEIVCRDIRLVIGNHDSVTKDFKENFRIVDKRLDVIFNHQRIVLDHYSMRVWDRSHHGAWHLYGHSHGSLPDDPNSLSFDVGVDCHKYHPISFDEVSNIMKKKTWKPVDHHK